MRCRQVIDVVEKSYPRSMAMDWDNVGLLVGSKEKEIRRIYVALDAEDQVIEAAAQAHADLLITHHPMIFSPMKRITDEDFIGRRVIKLIKLDMAYYAMHTNYDVMGMAQAASRTMEMKDDQVLEVTCPQGPVDGRAEGIGRVADLEEEISLRTCCDQVKERFLLDTVKVFGDLKAPLKRIAISPGAGKSMVAAALEMQADVLITGDIDHHTGIDALAQGLAIIDAGHYGVEKIFIRDIAEFLRRELADVTVIEAPVCNPFQVL